MDMGISTYLGERIDTKNYLDNNNLVCGSGPISVQLVLFTRSYEDERDLEREES